MATIRKEIHFRAPADVVWAAVRDVGSPHLKLTPGVLTDSRLDGEARVVTFANDMVARELIVDVDEVAQRVAYAVVGDHFRHHNASMQVFADHDGSRLVWITDILPHERAGMVRSLVEQGAAAMQRTLDGAAEAA